jgi:hypothetical protein
MNTGKILLSTKFDVEVKVRLRAAATVRLRADTSYLLVGDVGGLRRSIARWMIDRGAKNLILLSHSAGNVEKTDVCGRIARGRLSGHGN